MKQASDRVLKAIVGMVAACPAFSDEFLQWITESIDEAHARARQSRGEERDEALGAAAELMAMRDTMKNAPEIISQQAADASDAASNAGGSGDLF